MQKERLQHRVRLTLQVIQDHAADSTHMTSSDVWEAITQRLPLEGDERDPQVAGPAGEVRWRWSTVDLAHAGWLQKDPGGSGVWTLTSEGRRALDQYPEPGDFNSALVVAAREAMLHQKLTQQQRLAAEIIPGDVKQERVIAAARAFIDSAFTTGESAFVPGRTIWTPENLGVLQSVLAGEAPEQSAALFESWLVGALDGVGDDVKLLTAELLTLQFLPISGGIGQATKEARAQRILTSMSRPVDIPEVIRTAFTGGAFGVGFPMVQNLARSARYVATVMRAWVAQLDDAKEHLLESPLDLRNAIEGFASESFPSQRNALLYLVHPTYFGPVVSDDNKRQIVAAFGGEVPELSGDLERDLHDITIALQVKNGHPIAFWDARWKPRWQGGASESEPSPMVEPVAPTPEDVHTLAGRLKLDTEWLLETIVLIRERKQVIFTGPPGTGKTYIAQQVAEFLATGPEAFEVVQFHPSYSYEDFFEGYRPGRDGAGFVLKPGPFRRLAERARANLDLTYVLLIDEINRGNLSKIFGELYFLLEYRDRAITLLYGDEDQADGGFTLPPNVLILGTMNTADRSIALLDAAMRRRFAFVELHPDRSPVREMFSRWLTGRPMAQELAALLPALNARIPDDAWKIGPSYLMKSDMTEARLRSIWRYDIIPLLAELHYGDGTDVDSRYGLDALRASLAPPADA